MYRTAPQGRTVEVSIQIPFRNRVQYGSPFVVGLVYFGSLTARSAGGADRAGTAVLGLCSLALAFLVVRIFVLEQSRLRLFERPARVELFRRRLFRTVTDTLPVDASSTLTLVPGVYWRSPRWLPWSRQSVVSLVLQTNGREHPLLANEDLPLESIARDIEPVVVALDELRPGLPRL
jgi:hypothetical protein